jgi:hypothetical protein
VLGLEEESHGGGGGGGSVAVAGDVGAVGFWVSVLTGFARLAGGLFEPI